MESDSESDDEKSHSHSEDGKPKDFQKNLNSIHYFLLSLFISYVGSRYKLSRMSWY